MSVLRALYAELVYGGHLLAAGTSSIAATAALAIGRAPTWDLVLMAYLVTFGAYSLNRAEDFEEDRVSQPARTAYLEGRRRRLPQLAAGCFALGYALAFFRNITFFLALVAPLVLAVLYSVGSSKMKSVTGISRLKEGLLVKNVTISFGWSLIPILVALYFQTFSVAVPALSVLVFIRLMVNTVFFDVRDVEADSRKGVRTLPSALGTKRTERLLDGLDLVSAAYPLLAASLALLPVAMSYFAVFPAYSLAYRWYGRRARAHQDFVRDFLADGEYALWGVVAYLGQA